MIAVPGFIDAHKRIHQRTAECAGLLGGGISLPDLAELEDYVIIHTKAPDGAPMGKANFIVAHKSTQIGKGARFKFAGTHNVVVLGANVELGSTTISCFGKFGCIIISDESAFKTCRIATKHRNSTVAIGRGMSWVGGSIVVSEDDNSVVIGDGCLFSWDIEIMPTDGHPIYDRSTGQRINTAKPIVIGSKVWMGRGASIGKGVKIAQGTIIGQGSLVTKDTDPFSAYGGVPAKLLRRDVEWRRSFKEEFLRTED